MVKGVRERWENFVSSSGGRLLLNDLVIDKAAIRYLQEQASFQETHDLPEGLVIRESQCPTESIPSMSDLLSLLGDRLKLLLLSGNSWGPHRKCIGGFLEAANRINKPSKLQKLTFVLESLQETEIHILGQILCNPHFSINKFVCSHCQITDEVRPVALGMRKCNLVSLVLHSCRIDAHMLSTIVNLALTKDNGCLKMLNLCNNHLNASSLLSLAKLVQHQTCLERLLLSSNQNLFASNPNPYSTNLFFRSIGNHNKLITLHMANVQMGPLTALKLFHALQGKPSLEWLDLGDNPLIDGPWLLLVSANQSLRTLALPAMSVGMKSMVHGIGRNTSLTHIECSDTRRRSFIEMTCRRNNLLKFTSSPQKQPISLQLFGPSSC